MHEMTYILEIGLFRWTYNSFKLTVIYREAVFTATCGHVFFCTSLAYAQLHCTFPRLCGEK